MKASESNNVIFVVPKPKKNSKPEISYKIDFKFDRSKKLKLWFTKLCRFVLNG